MQAVIEAAKQNEHWAKRALRSVNARVWTYEELEALNFYRAHREEIERQEAVRVHRIKQIRRSINTSEEAKSVWVKSYKGWMLMKLCFEDNVERFWMMRDDHLICDITRWR